MILNELLWYALIYYVQILVVTGVLVTLWLAYKISKLFRHKVYRLR